MQAGKEYGKNKKSGHAGFLDAARVAALCDPALAQRGTEALRAKAAQAEDGLGTRIETILSHPEGQALLCALFSYSPFLTRLALQHPELLAQCCEEGPDACFRELVERLA